MATVEEGESGKVSPRASWKMIAAALAGRVSERWTELRSVRFDGPKATDANLETLATAGYLDHIETLHLASEQLSPRGVEIALSLPVLTTLRLERVSVPRLAPRASSVRSLEFFYCGPDTCASLVGAVATLSAINLESVYPRRDHGIVWNAVAKHGLRFARIAHAPLTGAALDEMLASSADSLESLLLDDVPGLDSDEFLAGRSWPALRAFQWHRGTIAEFGAHLPAQLSELSLRETLVATFHVGPWASSLTSLDCVKSSVSETMAVHIDANLGKLVHLGLASSAVAIRTVETLSAMPDSSLRSLEFGDSFVSASRDLGAGSVLGSVPAALESFTLDHAWGLDENLLRDLLRGDRAPGLRNLSLQDTNIGNPDLGGGFSANLRRLAVRYSGGFIEGLGSARPVALTHLTLEEVEVRSDELIAVLRCCKRLTSLRLANVACFGAAGLRDALVHVSGQLVQLSLGRFSDDAIPENGDALLEFRYPVLAELHLDDTTFSPRAFAHLMAADVTPALERLSLDCAPTDEQWLSVVERPPSDLHWIDGRYAGKVESLLEVLRDPASGVVDAVLHLRRQPR
jgi:hypothetical protein